jgi:hypothetical protein
MAAAQPAPSASPDARAETIFAATRAAFVARTYPSELAYGVRVGGLRGTTWTYRTYRTFERWPAGRISARTISDEETANPAHPTGSNFSLPFFSNATGDGDTLKDIVGTPRLAVTYAFGLAPRPADAPLPGDVATPAPGAPREIGTVVAVKRNYDVRLAGEETVDGIACWHLTLAPLGNPGTYRVRDLYVDEANDQTVRLRTDGNFTLKATGRGLWTVDYVEVDGSWYLSDETSAGAIDTDAGSYDKVDVRFVDVHADPRENLDFGISGSDDVQVLEEP